MPPAYWCLLIGGLLPYAAVGLAKFSPGSGYDNARPRETEAEMTGFRARAVSAHHNSFEAFLLFAPAVLAAGQLGFAGPRLDQLAISWVVLRLVYLAVYCLGWARLRSVVWTAATAVTVAIFTLPIWA
jgi:uncharacterized MAPEG superfamily protein